jgi:hypothetical protein
MRPVGIILLLPLLAPAIKAADMTTTETAPFTPPPYQLLRFDENYIYLTNAADHTDWFDPIKYIPLRANEPYWYLTFGGEARERFEGVHDPNFGIVSGPDSYWVQRLTFLSDLHLGERLRLFAEGISGLIEGEVPPAPPVQNDPIDLAYSFVDLVPYLSGDESLTLRAGRYGMSLGSGRLVATRAAPSAPNIPFRFDGFEMLYSARSWEATAFLNRPAKDSGHIDGSNLHTAFWGLYLTHWLDAPRLIGLDLYYLGIVNNPGRYASGTADEARQSFGLRCFGTRNHWEWNFEDVVQVGTFGDQSIFAWTSSSAVRYTFDTLWHPQLAVRADIASGTHSRHGGQQGTFDALFPNPEYYNNASLLRPANLIDLHPYVVANFTRTVSANGGFDVFWRYSTSDAIYAPSGNIEIPALNTGTAYFATAVDVNFQWKIQRHLTFNASFVHFFTGSYVHAAGGSDVNFVSTTLTFLF